MCYSKQNQQQVDNRFMNHYTELIEAGIQKRGPRASSAIKGRHWRGKTIALHPYLFVTKNKHHFINCITVCGGVSVWVNDTHIQTACILSYHLCMYMVNKATKDYTEVTSLHWPQCFVLQNTALPLDITTHIHSKDLHPVTYKWSQKISHKHTSDGADWSFRIPCYGTQSRFRFMTCRCAPF